MNDKILAGLYDRVPGLRWAQLIRSVDRIAGVLMFHWTVVLHVPRMGKRGQRTGRGEEALNGTGDTPSDAADSAVRFFELRCQGLV